MSVQSRIEPIVTGVKWLLAIALTSFYIWSAGAALILSPEAAGALRFWAGLSLLLGLLEREVWAWCAAKTPLTPAQFRLIAQPALGAALVFALAAALPASLAGSVAAVIGLGLLNLLLLLLGLVLRERDRAGLSRLALSLISFGFTLLLIEWLIAPAAYRILTAPHPAAEETPALETPVLPEAPFDIATLWDGTMKTEPVGPAGPGPEWGLRTGWGTNTDTTIHAWMDGVFDVEVRYNSLGFRGPEITYDKPDDVYRVLIVGDSFVEALQVEYADTIYAQLGAMLADTRTLDGRQVEVFGIGATGWGTLQAFLYYHYEGVNFAPDLIVNVFFINDVVDNYPEHFYGGLRDLGFIIEGDGVRAYDPTRETRPTHIQDHTFEDASPAKRWLDALPGALQGSAIVGLVRLWADPPRLVAGIEGGLRGTHPQNFVFVREPEIEGYAEAWYRTQCAYEIWAKEVKANGAELWVTAIDLSPEMVDIIASFYTEETAGWVWDPDLPYTRLAQILAPLDVPLVLTREAYQAQAERIGQPVYPTIFILEDGHWSATGHRVMAELLAETLRARGILQ